MHKKLRSLFKPFLSSLLLIVLISGLAFGHSDSALAARSGGRIGGGSFRAPSRTYTAPRSPSRAPTGGYYPGGGFGFPFLFPIFGIGGGAGGLFTILIGLAIANFLFQSFRRATSGEDLEGGYNSNPSISIARLQVGLLASARSLQTDLDRIAETANTRTPEGLSQVLQETTLSLLRHPEYWAYATGQTQQARLEAAETQFNRLALAERSKFTEETLTNVNSQGRLQQATPQGALVETDASEGPGEYIVATILVGAEGNLQLPAINSTADLRRALSQIGAIPSYKLMALEVLWAPQAAGDTLTSDQLLAEYPDLKLI
ncbi:MAG: DUF1517 domain-containing protein [Leptolyngbyaceae bacterium]|nr:DUF1517 domain-containing protein [Leptolyngbyaceae bacterium]